jgi:hypothetical protein
MDPKVAPDSILASGRNPKNLDDRTIADPASSAKDIRYLYVFSRFLKR